MVAVIAARYSHYTADNLALVLDLGIVVLLLPLVVMAIMFMSFVCGLNAFNYLHNRNISDMHLALPIAHKGRFWASFMSGLVVVALPYISSFLVGLLIFRIFTNVGNFEEFINLGHYIITGSASMGTVETAPLTIDGFIAQHLFPIAFTGFVVLVFIYVLTVFCNMICGKLLTAGFFPFLLSVLIPLMIFALSTLAIHNAHGITGIGSYPYIISSPLGMFFGTIGIAGEYIVYTMTQPVYLFPSMLIIGGLLTAAFYLSKNIKAENIGRDFLYKGIYNTQQALMCLCIIALFVLLFLNLRHGTVMFLAFFVSFVVYFTAHLIHYKGFNKMKNGLIKYGIMMLTSVLVCVFLVAGRGFGASNHVPSTNSVQAVRITQFGTPTIISDTFPTNRQHEFKREANYTRDEWRDIVDEARRLHRQFIETRTPTPIENREFWNRDIYTFSVEYVLNNGLVVSRQYHYDRSGIRVLVEAGVLLPERPRRFTPSEDLPWWDIFDDVYEREELTANV
jgi:hypothetical protein